MPVALRPVKQCAWLHQRTTALLGSAIGAVRLRWRGSWRITLRLSLGADARHLLVDALLILRLDVPGPIACSRAMRHSQLSTLQSPSTELNMNYLLCEAHAGNLFESLCTMCNCKTHCPVSTPLYCRCSVTDPCSSGDLRHERCVFLSARKVCRTICDVGMSGIECIGHSTAACSHSGLQGNSKRKSVLPPYYAKHEFQGGPAAAGACTATRYSNYCMPATRTALRCSLERLGCQKEVVGLTDYHCRLHQEEASQHLHAGHIAASGVNQCSDHIWASKAANGTCTGGKAVCGIACSHLLSRATLFKALLLLRHCALACSDGSRTLHKALPQIKVRSSRDSKGCLPPTWVRQCQRMLGNDPY